jgi:hypothetical protein
VHKTRGGSIGTTCRTDRFGPFILYKCPLTGRLGTDAKRVRSLTMLPSLSACVRFRDGLASILVIDNFATEIECNQLMHPPIRPWMPASFTEKLHAFKNSLQDIVNPYDTLDVSKKMDPRAGMWHSDGGMSGVVVVLVYIGHEWRPLTAQADRVGFPGGTAFASGDCGMSEDGHVMADDWIPDPSEVETIAFRPGRLVAFRGKVCHKGMGCAPNMVRCVLQGRFNSGPTTLWSPTVASGKAAKPRQHHGEGPPVVGGGR